MAIVVKTIGKWRKSFLHNQPHSQYGKYYYCLVFSTKNSHEIVIDFSIDSNWILMKLSVYLLQSMTVQANIVWADSVNTCADIG